MKIRSTLAGVGAAMVFALAAQAAEASTVQCPGGNDGSGEYQSEVPQDGGEPCPSSGGSVAWNETVTQPDGTAYEAAAEVPGGGELLPAGEYIEVEIDLDATVALLKSDDALAMKAAVALGLRDPSFAVEHAAFRSPVALMGKLSDIELKLVARHVHSAMKVQNGGRGRSNTSNGFLSRVEAFGQAVSRAVSSFIGRLPTSGNFLAGTREYYPNGNVKKESGVVLRVERQAEPE